MSNTLFSYYFLLIGTVQAQTWYGKLWQQHYYHKITLLNLFKLAGHGVARLMNCDPSMPFHPEKTMEAYVEKFFGRIKSYHVGQGRVKDSIQGTTLEHLRQLRDDKFLEKGRKKIIKRDDRSKTNSVRVEAPISATDAMKIARNSLAAAFQMHAILTPGEDQESLLEKTRSWWRSKGRQFMMSAPENKDDDGEEDLGSLLCMDDEIDDADSAHSDIEEVDLQQQMQTNVDVQGREDSEAKALLDILADRADMGSAIRKEFELIGELMNFIIIVRIGVPHVADHI